MVKARETEVTTVTPVLNTPEDHRKFFGNWSKAIRALHAQGVTNSEIAKRLGKRPQHVRNVLTTPLKRQLAKANAEAKS